MQGSSHTRLRSYVTNAINTPNALRRIALLVQPSVVAGLASWAEKGRILAFDEARKVWNFDAFVGRLSCLFVIIRLDYGFDVGFEIWGIRVL